MTDFKLLSREKLANQDRREVKATKVNMWVNSFVKSLFIQKELILLINHYLMILRKFF